MTKCSIGATALAAALLLPPPAPAKTIAFEDFESYATTADLLQQWVPSNPSSPNGGLVDETYTAFLTLDDDAEPIGARAFPNGGQGAVHLGSSVFEFAGLTAGGAPLVPTADRRLQLDADIFDVGAIPNKRMSVGLRSTTPENLIEIGHYNSEPSGLAGRAVLFATGPSPNYFFYDLPLSLDSPTDSDSVTTTADLGEAWHHHRVTIGPTGILYEIDLFRDGVDARTGLPGFDASEFFDLAPTANGFNSLRFGGPSGVSSSGNGFYGGAIFDNIRLAWVPEPSAAVMGLVLLGAVIVRRRGR
jgi:hypothetical protein